MVAASAYSRASRVFDATGDLLMTLGSGLLTGAVVGLAFLPDGGPAGLPASYLLICFSGLTSSMAGLFVRSLAPSLASRLLRSRM